MEFWAVAVKSGEPLKVTPGDGMVLHLSQACLGELKKDKGNEAVCLLVNVDGKKLVLGTLFTEKLPQQQFDLVFDRDFELLHNWRAGSVYFYGYKARNPSEAAFPEEESDESDSEEDIQLTVRNYEKPQTKAKQDQSVNAQKANAIKDKKSDAGKQKVKIVEPKKDVKPEEDEESSDDDLMSEDDKEDNSEDEDDSDDESGESEEATPNKVKSSKRQAATEPATKKPIQGKKVKLTPPKTEGNKVGIHVATPHPVKQAGKTAANKPNQQTSKSGGSHSCKSCNRTFGSEQALESHAKAKHG